MMDVGWGFGRILLVTERLPEVFDTCVVALQHEIEWSARSLDFTSLGFFSVEIY